MKNVLIINASPVRTGATARIVELAAQTLGTRYTVRSVCIDDYTIGFCHGCRTCHETAKCVQTDDVERLIAEYAWADCIVSVAPSYWADVPGQFKVFIDRCTPWCDTHEPHAALPDGKKGYSIVLRTGTSMRECQRLIETIEHFYGHMHIASSGSLALCGVENRGDVAAREAEIFAFCEKI